MKEFINRLWVVRKHFRIPSLCRFKALCPYLLNIIDVGHGTIDPAKLGWSSLKELRVCLLPISMTIDYLIIFLAAC